MKPPLGLNGVTILFSMNILAVLMVFIWFYFRCKTAQKDKIPFLGLIPSKISRVEDAQKMLRWDTRMYYIYAILLNVGVQTILHFELEIDILLFMLPTTLQIALFFLILQTYRKLFALSTTIKKNTLLGLGLFFWILFFFLLGLEQIIRFPIFFGVFLIILTGDVNAIFPFSSVYIWFATFAYLILGIAGEYLFKRVFPDSRMN